MNDMYTIQSFTRPMNSRSSPLLPILAAKRASKIYGVFTSYWLDWAIGWNGQKFVHVNLLQDATFNIISVNWRDGAVRTFDYLQAAANTRVAARAVHSGYIVAVLLSIYAMLPFRC